MIYNRQHPGSNPDDLYEWGRSPGEVGQRKRAATIIAFGGGDVFFSSKDP